MAEETVTTGTSPGPTTVIRESGSSGMGILIAVILLIAVVGGLYLFSQNSSSEAAKDNAIAEAANHVGNAASQVGDAAKDTAEKADPNN